MEKEWNVCLIDIVLCYSVQLDLGLSSWICSCITHILGRGWGLFTKLKCPTMSGTGQKLWCGGVKTIKLKFGSRKIMFLEKMGEPKSIKLQC